jgi:2-iminobutanoate/2-iminopropanoate deaminase
MSDFRPTRLSCKNIYRLLMGRSRIFHRFNKGLDLASMSNQGKTAISTKEAPAAIGPYSQAIRTGDLLFASGQVGLDPATGQMVSGGVVEQTVRVLENVKAILAEAGLNMSHVVKTTVYLKSMADFAAMNEVYAKYLAPSGTVPPARSTVAVAGLPKDALVEIEVIARQASAA